MFQGLKIRKVDLVMDKLTDRFKGICYVEFEDVDNLEKAVSLNGTLFVEKKCLRIDVADARRNDR